MDKNDKKISVSKNGPYGAHCSIGFNKHDE